MLCTQRQDNFRSISPSRPFAVRPLVSVATRCKHRPCSVLLRHDLVLWGIFMHSWLKRRWHPLCVSGDSFAHSFQPKKLFVFFFCFMFVLSPALLAGKLPGMERFYFCSFCGAAQTELSKSRHCVVLGSPCFGQLFNTFPTCFTFSTNEGIRRIISKSQ